MSRMSKIQSVAALTAAVSSFAFGQTYQFSIDPERTFTEGVLDLQFFMSGSFRGDYEANKNPGGSRTLPGHTDSENPLGNAPVLSRSKWTLSEATDFHTIGTFQLAVDWGIRKAQLSSYSIERLASAPLSLRAQYVFETEPFRSVSPDSWWKGEEPAMGTTRMQLDRIKIRQKPGPREGALVPLEDGWYRVSVNFMAEVEVDILDFDQLGPLTFTVAASLVGNLRQTSEGAVFGYPKGKGGDNWARSANVPLDDFPVVLNLNDGKGVRVRYLPNIDSFAFKLNGLRQFHASGTPVP